VGPALDGALLRERYDRVALVYLDAFGWTFLERQARHPLVRRAATEGHVVQLTSQFPSTTAAHVTTIHTGQPVADHGVYEWFVLEPTLDRLIAPLLFSYAGDGARETLAGVLDPRAVYPGATLYQRFAAAGIASCAAQSAAFAHSSASRALLDGATIIPFTNDADGLGAAARFLAEEDRAYAFVYLDAVDGLMHAIGPEQEAVHGAFAAALTAVERAPFPPGTLVLLTADHGMSPVDPARTVYVNAVWPELSQHLALGADGKPLAPAGSCRDLFLHTRAGRADDVCDRLGELLVEVAEVTTTSTLIADGVFADPSPVFRRRLADVVVLPRHGEAVYWHEPGRFVQHLHGQHGGLSPQEMEIPLLAWVT
jgi:Type I phosphodiesterase / nucleotide pyrophosphatase